MYVCALRSGGEPLSRTDLFGYIARLQRAPGAALHSLVDGPFAAIATGGGAAARPQVARFRHLIAAGDVRLDNREEIRRMTRLDAADVESDLMLVLAALDAVGEACIPRLLGDFAFVAWDARAQKLVAVRDAFGVKPLFHRMSGELVLFASDVGALHDGGSYDTDYISSYLTSGVASPQRTIWRNVSAVPAGSLVRQRGTVRARERYWSPEEFQPAETSDAVENCSRFRELLTEGVRTRIEGAGDVWAQLSGGLDSSSIVAIAGMLEGSSAKLGGTITVVDSMGEGDERQFSDAVVRRFQLRNEQVRDYWAWQDDGDTPPLTDQPTALYPFYARERRIWDTVRGAGSSVLLSGLGADHYLYGSLDYITDLASTWQIRSALREVTTWSVATRQSFWGLGRRYLLDPFLPQTLQPVSSTVAPAWARGGAPARAGGTYGFRPRHRFAQRIADGLHALPSWIERWPADEAVEMRYPFLYRPLVEWSLALPATQRVRPNEQKWILREATRGILPEEVRTRSTKGGIDARLLWSLHREKARVDAMLRDPILAQIGCIEPRLLREAADAARRGVPVNNVQLFSALSLETWLAVQTGQWSVLPQTAATAA